MLYIQHPGFLAKASILTGAILLSGCKIGGSSGGDDQPSEQRHYSATIERTTYGIPHITAKDLGGAGYGHGYAIAEDNLCVLADAFVTYSGQRSEYFGPDEAAATMGTFGTPTNLEADFFFRFLLNEQELTTFQAAQADDMLELTAGFAAGYSRYVSEVKDGEHAGRHTDCRNAEWLRTITTDDVLRRLVALNLAASSANWVEEIVAAQPPAANPARVRLMSPATDTTELTADRFALGRKTGIGSNTYAFGGNATESGGGLLFANPHWYLLGVDRFYQLHMNVPGKLNVSGASIMGTPMVLMGFNNDIAWAHTVSTARRFTLYQLQLAEGDPTSYVKDSEVVAMTPTEITIQVKQTDGNLSPVTRTLYRSEYGPMISLSGLGLPGWGTQVAYTLRDANLENTRAFQNFFSWGSAGSLDEFYNNTKQYLGIPWVNTTAIGRGDQRALYSDITVVPNVPDSMLASCLVPTLGPAVMNAVPGLPLLDGTRSACDWKTDTDSVQSGTFGPSNLPSLFSTDYVANMNDSYWLSNPEQPLTGYAGIIGSEDYEQSLRTRMGHTMVRDRLNGADGLNGHLASSENLRNIVLNSRVYSAERLKTAVLNVVCDAPGSADEEQACQVLANWDNTGNLDAVGAHIWTALWSRIRSLDLYAIPFDAADPINTPDGLSNDSAVRDQITAAFSEAVTDLVNRNIALNARVEQVQQYLKPGEQIPQFGGEGNEGYFTVLRNSYMHIVEFPNGEPVKAYTFLTHSQSTDPSSPHYADYTQAYSNKNWLPFPYTDEDIAANLESSIDISE